MMSASDTKPTRHKYSSPTRLFCIFSAVHFKLQEQIEVPSANLGAHQIIQLGFRQSSALPLQAAYTLPF